MALQGPFPVEFGTVFPSGVYAAGGFEKVRDFDRSSGDRVVQQADKATRPAAGAVGRPLERGQGTRCVAVRRSGPWSAA